MYSETKNAPRTCWMGYPIIKGSPILVKKKKTCSSFASVG